MLELMLNTCCIWFNQGKLSATLLHKNRGLKKYSSTTFRRIVSSAFWRVHALLHSESSKYHTSYGLASV